MNGFIIEISPIKDYEIVNNNYSKVIHSSLMEIFKLYDKMDMKVSNIFGMFYENNIKLYKDKKYKIRVVTKKEDVFHKITKELFEVVINKEKLKLGELECKLTSIITSDKTWCGEYNIEKEYNKIELENDFYKKMDLKVVTPVFKNEKSVFGFENILEIILDELTEEKIVKGELKDYKENIMNSIFVNNELFRQKYMKTQKIYLGDINLELRGYYGEILYIILNYIKFTGVGENKEYGYGEIIVEERDNADKKNKYIKKGRGGI